jgi:hypothetical protein
MCVFGQEKLSLQVFDAHTRMGIPYATVKVLNKPEGAYANANGLVLIIANRSDSLLVSCVGYKPAKLLIESVDTVFLQPVAIALDEVKVNATKRKEKSFGYYNKKKIGSLRSVIQIEHAIKLTVTPENISYRIKKVKIKCGNRKDSNLMRLHIYSIGKDGLPDKELLPKDIIINNSIKMNDEIDLSNFNLVLSERVLYVGVEWINRNHNPKSGPMNWIWVGFTNSDRDNRTLFRTLRDPEYRWRDDLVTFKYHNLMVSLVID